MTSWQIQCKTLLKIHLKMKDKKYNRPIQILIIKPVKRPDRRYYF